MNFWGCLRICFIGWIVLVGIASGFETEATAVGNGAGDFKAFESAFQRAADTTLAGPRTRGYRTLVEALVPAPPQQNSSDPVAVRIKLLIFGPEVIPFEVADQQAILLGLNDTVDAADYQNIEIVSIQEFLPSQGPSSQSINSSAGGFTIASTASPSPSPTLLAVATLRSTSPTPSPPSGRRLLGTPLGFSGRGGGSRKLRQEGSPTVIEQEARVVVEVRIRTTLALAATVQQEVLTDYNTTFVESLQRRGVKLQGIRLERIELEENPPPKDTAAAPGPSTNGTRSELPKLPPPYNSSSLSGAAIGLIVGLGLPGLILFGLLAGFVWRRRHQPSTLLATSTPSSSPRPLPASPTSGDLHSVSTGEGMGMMRMSKSGSAAVLEDGKRGVEEGFLAQGKDVLGSSESDSEGGSTSEARGNGQAPVGSQRDEFDLMRTGSNLPETGDLQLGGSGWDAKAWNVHFKDLQFSRQIGEGSFGKVFLGKWRETTVAIKVLNTYETDLSRRLNCQSDPLSPADEELAVSLSIGPAGGGSWGDAAEQLRQDLQKEAGLMSGLRHPNVVMFLGACISPSDPPCMVTEFCARGSLLDVLQNARKKQGAYLRELDWVRRLGMGLDAAKGMLYLHGREPPILHRDLKSANLLVEKHWKVKLADFNLSRVMNVGSISSSIVATNPRWMAPEVLKGDVYNKEADVYSFGIVLWELLTLQVPWEDAGPWQIVIAVTELHQRPEIPAEDDLIGGRPQCYEAYLALMRDCWGSPPDSRPDFDTIITRIREMLEVEVKAAEARRATLVATRSLSLPLPIDSLPLSASLPSAAK